MVVFIAAPILVVLIVQVTAFPLTLQSEVIYEVSAKILSVMCNMYIY